MIRVELRFCFTSPKGSKPVIFEGERSKSPISLSESDDNPVEEEDQKEQAKEIENDQTQDTEKEPAKATGNDQSQEAQKEQVKEIKKEQMEEENKPERKKHPVARMKAVTLK